MIYRELTRKRQSDMRHDLVREDHMWSGYSRSDRTDTKKAQIKNMVRNFRSGTSRLQSLRDTFRKARIMRSSYDDPPQMCRRLPLKSFTLVKILQWMNRCHMM
ncbi:hypothetical protein AVEN_56673-1 [Araneus ventricosus]|uniref:Uncharacterized protein n=1 Tax=Araneus ventricosus TaxID=182803 RepID=A0A4Y2LXU6_ARAVE|nr:hypothetical protein AVEN_56673-1 [Araneus ventricosus]